MNKHPYALSLLFSLSILFCSSSANAENSFVNQTDSVSSLTSTLRDAASGPRLSSPQEISSLVPLVQQRKELLLELIRKNPSDFLRQALPRTVRNKLPESLQANVEIDTTATSMIEVLHVDAFKNFGRSEYRYFITISPPKSRISLLGLFGLDSTPTQPAERVELFPTKDLLINSGAKVKVRGYKLAGLMALDGSSETNFQVVEDAPKPDSAGDQKTLFILVKATDNEAEPFTPEEFKPRIFDGNFEKFMEEQSYDKVSFSGDVVGWYTLGHDLDCYNGGQFFPDNNELQAIAEKYHIDFAKYKRLAYIIPSNHGGCSSIGIYPIKIGETNYNLSQLLIEGAATAFDFPFTLGAELKLYNWTLFDSILSHEMGHSLGLMHANSWQCTDNTVLYGSCSHKEYGNDFDIMGSNGKYSMDYNAFFKQRLGWVPEDHAVHITKSGTYTLNPLELKNGIQLADIRGKSNSSAIYSIEYRKGIGYDSGLNLQKSDLLYNCPPELSCPDNPSINQRGIFINRIKGLSPATELLDMAPNERGRNDYASQVTLNLQGENSPSDFLVDKANGVTIGPVTAVTEDSVTFKVDIYDSVCERTIPVINSGASEIRAAVGGYASINFDITNNDFGCGPSSYSIIPKEKLWFQSSYPANNEVVDPGSKLRGIINIKIPSDTLPSSGSKDQYSFEFDIINDASGLKSSYKIPVIVQEPTIIFDITPSLGPIGTEVVINGNGFSDENVVWLTGQYGVGHKRVPKTNNQLRFAIPQNVIDTSKCQVSCSSEMTTPDGDYKITVNTNIGTSNALVFTVEAGEKSPYITSITPQKVPKNWSVSLGGVRFAPKGQTLTFIDVRTYKEVKTMKVYGTKNGQSIEFVPDVNPATYLIYISDPVTGKSNNVYLDVIRPLPTSTTLPETMASSSQIQTASKVSLFAKISNGLRSVVDSVAGLIGVGKSASPSPIPFFNRSSSPTPTILYSAGIIISPSPTVIPSTSASPRTTVSVSPIYTSSVSPVISTSVSPSPTRTPGAVPSATVGVSVTPTVRPSVSPTTIKSPTATPTVSPTHLVSPSPTAYSTPTNYPTATPTVTSTPWYSTPTPAATYSQTPTPTPVVTPTSTPYPTATWAPSPSYTPYSTYSPTPYPTPTPTPTSYSTPAVTYSPTPTASPTSTANPTSTPRPSTSPTPVSFNNSSKNTSLFSMLFKPWMNIANVVYAGFSM